jgi:intein/homing endonuclease
MRVLIDNIIELSKWKLQPGGLNEVKILEYVLQHHYDHGECPSDAGVASHFADDDPEVADYLDVIRDVDCLTGSNFHAHLKQVFKRQQDNYAIQTFREAVEIIDQPTEFEVPGSFRKEKKFGLQDALSHVYTAMGRITMADSGTKLSGDFVADAQDVVDHYQAAKADPNHGIGRLSGIMEIDRFTRGIKKGEVWTHCASTGHLKCVTGDTRVYDHRSKMVRTVQELYESGELPIVSAVYHEGSSPQIIQTSTSHLVQNGEREVFDLVLASGRSCGATKNHRFLTPSGWRQLNELRLGDFVATPSIMRVPDPRTDFSDAEVKTVGYLLGDGTLVSEISFCNSNPEIRDDFKSCLIKLGLTEGPANYVTPTFTDVPLSDRTRSVRVSRSWGDKHHPVVSPVRRLIGGLGLWGLDAHHKHVPDAFFALPLRQVSLLLGALWATDGSFSSSGYTRTDREKPRTTYNNAISYSTVSRDLARDVQSLLLRLGIQSHISPCFTEYEGDRRPFFTVSVVSRHSKRLFVQSVRPVGKEQARQDLNSRLELGLRDDRRIPSSVLSHLVGQKVKTASGRSWYVQEALKRPTITADSLRIFSQLDESLLGHIDGEIYWDCVKAVKYRGVEVTYDLEVPEHHTFVANDIVTHNTTFALNWAWQQAIIYRWNVVFLSLEMKKAVLDMRLFSMHSAHPKFKAMGFSPLPYTGIRDGELSPDQEVFLDIVKMDLLQGAATGDYGEIWIECPVEAVTVPDIQRLCEAKNREDKVGMVMVDRADLVESRFPSSNMTTSQNWVFKDAHAMALNFNQGEGLPVLLLAQMNREGLEHANANGGHYTVKHIAWANEAERSSDVITYSYLRPRGFRTDELDEAIRQQGRDPDAFLNDWMCGCLKNRDNPIFNQFTGYIDWDTRRMTSAVAAPPKAAKNTVASLFSQTGGFSFTT